MAHDGFKDLLRNGGFRAFLWTQFLGAYNDQTYQSIVLLYALTARGGIYKPLIPLVPAIFNLPFLLLSGYSGHLSDRIAKRTVLRSVKLFEILITAVGLAALTLARFDLMLVVVLLLACIPRYSARPNTALCRRFCRTRTSRAAMRCWR